MNYSSKIFHSITKESKRIFKRVNTRQKEIKEAHDKQKEDFEKTKSRFEHEYGSDIKAKPNENNATRPKPVFKPKR